MMLLKAEKKDEEIPFTIVKSGNKANKLPLKAVKEMEGEERYLIHI